MPVFTDNRDLLDRFRRGERRALSRVYDHYVHDVATLVRRGFTIKSQGLWVPGAGSVPAEHELIQDTFVRAFSEKARLGFDGLRPYRPYLLTIARNLMIDRHRATRRERSVGACDFEDLLESGAPLSDETDVADDLHWATLRRATAEFVAGLDPESRAVVRHRFEQEHGQHATAELLGCSRRRVRTLENRIQKALRKFLKTRGLLDT